MKQQTLYLGIVAQPQSSGMSTRDSLSKHKQVQVELAFRRAKLNRPPKGKVRVVVRSGFVTVFHYHHTILVWDLARHKALLTWAEKPTDRRILNAALAHLQDS